MSDDEGFDEVFRDLSAFVGKVSDDPKVDESVFGGIHQLEGDEAAPIDDELILGEDYVTYLIHHNDLDLDGFSFVVHERELEVASGDFRVRKELGVRVDCEDAGAEFRNGVLSLKLRRIDERDGGA